MSIEEAIMGGIVFKGKKDKPKEEEKGIDYRCQQFCWCECGEMAIADSG